MFIVSGGVAVPFKRTQTDRAHYQVLMVSCLPLQLLIHSFERPNHHLVIIKGAKTHRLKSFLPTQFSAKEVFCCCCYFNCDLGCIFDYYQQISRYSGMPAAQR